MTFLQEVKWLKGTIVESSNFKHFFMSPAVRIESASHHHHVLRAVYSGQHKDLGGISVLCTKGTIYFYFLLVELRTSHTQGLYFATEPHSLSFFFKYSKIIHAYWDRALLD